MGASRPLAAAALLIGLTCPRCEAQLVSRTYTFPFFQNVGTCAPFSYLVEQARDGAYAVVVEAEAAVQAALLVLVQDGKSVGIQSNGSFASALPVRITVRLPPRQLQYLETVFSDADVGVSGVDFSPDKAEFAKNGGGSFYVSRPIGSGLLKISAVGKGDMVMTSNTTYAEVTTGGSGSLYLGGLNGTVNVRQSETGALLLSTGSNAQVQGVNIGTGALSYTQGKCNVTNPEGQDPGASVCKQAGALQAPSQTLLWTCGINVTGPYICAGGGFFGVSGSHPIPCAVPDSQRVMLPASAMTA